MNIGNTHINNTNLSYDDIVKTINRSKEKEKQRMMKYLGDMNIQDRKVEDMMKRHKIGRWNVGLQKSMYLYDKDAYDRERNEIQPDEMNETIYKVNTLDSQLPNQTSETDVFDEIDEIDGTEMDGTNRDKFDFSELQNGYDDGDFYPEDRDEDDFDMD